MNALTMRLHYLWCHGAKWHCYAVSLRKIKNSLRTARAVRREFFYSHGIEGILNGGFKNI